MKLVADRPTVRQTDQQTDRPTDIVTYRAAIAAKKSMKLDKSLGGRIAHLEVPSSRKFLNPPNELKSKKRECQSKQFIIRRPSMRGFFDR